MLLRILLLFVTLTFICSGSTTLKLKIFPQNEKILTGVLIHTENHTGGFTRSLKFFDDQHILIGELIEDFDKFSNHISAKKINYFCSSQNQTIVFNDKNAKINIDGENINVNVPKDITFGTGFFDRSRSAINQALKGEEIDIKILVPEKEDWFTLTTYKAENISYNGSNAIMLTIIPKSFIIRMFAKEVIFIFDTTELHKPLEFIGVLPFLNSSCKPMTGKIYFSQ